MFIVKYTSVDTSGTRDEAYGPFQSLKSAECWAAAYFDRAHAWYVLPLMPAPAAYAKRKTVEVYQ